MTAGDAGTAFRVGRSSRLDGVLYDLRGPVAARAAELESRGERILRLNIGNPAPFGFEAPTVIVEALREALPHAHGYSESPGLPETREAIRAHYARRAGFPSLGIEAVTVGNGVSELVGLTLQALLEPGDEVLIPSPDYPLWTASTVLAGGEPVHYPCVEEAGWLPDLDAMAAAIGPRTVAVVVINPNNPTGAVYPRETLEGIAELARRHGLLLLSDEIYDRVVYPGFTHVSTAQVAPDVPCVTFAGLSKTHRVAGYRAAWALTTGFAADDPFLSGLRLLASMRMCASVPAQHAITAALEHDTSLDALVSADGRLTAQRDAATAALRAIPGVDVHEAGGGLYLFPRLDPEMYGIRDDERLVLDFLDAERVLLVHGRAFNGADTDHVRIAFLPETETLVDAVQRFGRFLQGYSPPGA
ncbi:aminotransferase class I/II-fold pyridoxal phosphate-dependent enzyme [Microbacterium sp. K36]|uniref:aminotransferase class I/II-fold pyridoxal phosphate-dependent enzyme n=1 Tax=Microbacterium sp. K36 TaxID=2305439 RepID=UPI00109C007E|nr:aminotransferase class I/II-fold pyridoxal phosphate-dependent enzyme [Microbacterium sp. K36]